MAKRKRKRPAPAQYRDKKTGRFVSRATWLAARRRGSRRHATVPTPAPRKRPARPRKRPAKAAKPRKRPPTLPPPPPAPDEPETIRLRYLRRDVNMDIDVELLGGEPVGITVTDRSRRHPKAYTYTDDRSLRDLAAVLGAAWTQTEGGPAPWSKRGRR